MCREGGRGRGRGLQYTVGFIISGCESDAFQFHYNSHWRVWNSRDRHAISKDSTDAFKCFIGESWKPLCYRFLISQVSWNETIIEYVESSHSRGRLFWPHLRVLDVRNCTVVEYCTVLYWCIIPTISEVVVTSLGGSCLFATVFLSSCPLCWMSLKGWHFWELRPVFHSALFATILVVHENIRLWNLDQYVD